MNDSNSSGWQRVVVRLGSKTIRGYLEPFNWNTIEDILSTKLPGSDEKLRVRLLDSDDVEDISLAEAKAVFFVNTFNGDPTRNHINFHNHTPFVQGIWMRLEFLDGEVMEGIVNNSIRYMVDPGFFMLPTDPGSNNKLVYVSKKWLADHRVLGLRKVQLSSTETMERLR